MMLKLNRKKMLPVSIVVTICLVTIAVAAATSQNSGQVSHQADHVRMLIQRILPANYSYFAIEIDFELSDNNKDVFILQTWRNRSDDRHQLRIRASSGVAAAWAFNYYLKTYCNCHYGWQNEQMQLPANWPIITNATRITANDRFRYYQNMCTSSYSFVWWTWPDYERHLDWALMNSFNLILAPTAQEFIWWRIFRTLNLTETEINDFFTGPAFLAWYTLLLLNRMGNLRKWAGNLTVDWYGRSVALQKQILQRIRAFGAKAILPGFSGHVPHAFKRLFPYARFSEMPNWSHFTSEYSAVLLVDPNDPLFTKIGQEFMQQITNEFGTDHYYSCDTFNEMVPSSGNPQFLANISRAIFQTMLTIDPQSIWVLQNWLFIYDLTFWLPQRVRAFVTAVPLGRMLILDLQSEQWPMYKLYDSYYGQPFIWCMLQNFGGTLGLLGSTTLINQRVLEARSNSTTMIGIGLTPEGINQNYPVYELMMENAWIRKPFDLQLWFEKYARRRYGHDNRLLTKAWQLLQISILDFKGLEKMRGKYVVNRSPSMKIKVWFWYEVSDVFRAWELFLMASDCCVQNSCFRHDLVDLSRQILQNLIDLTYEKLLVAFRNRNLIGFRKMSATFLDLFADMDSILSTNENFLLGKWLNAAKSLSKSKSEQLLYEFNARNQITIWGPNGEIKDYASKQWAGLVKDYFAPRWYYFIRAMNESLTNGTVLDTDSIRQQIFDQIEKPFSYRTPYHHYTDQASGDSIDMAKKLYSKWSKFARELFNEKSVNC